MYLSIRVSRGFIIWRLHSERIVQRVRSLGRTRTLFNILIALEASKLKTTHEFAHRFVARE